jgi:lysophospholipase L1-like esterase
VVLINAVLITIILIAVELFLAGVAPVLPPNGPTEQGLFTWGIPVTSNSDGFRERELLSPKPPGVLRIMVLGDSLTWGVGLTRDQRYTEVTERLLNEKLPGSPGIFMPPAQDGDPTRIEVLNFGIIGGPTTLERDILKKHIEAVDPDLLVVGFCLNDTQPLAQNHSPERARFADGTGRLAGKMASGLGRVGLSHLEEVVQSGAYRLAELSGTIPTWEVALQRTYEPESTEWQAFNEALADMVELNAERGLPAPLFAILNQGSSTVEPTDYGDPDPELELFLDWYHQAEEAASQAGFIAYDHEQELTVQLTHESLAINQMDGHPSANLNHLYGEKLAAMILSRLCEMDLDSSQ